MILLAKVEKCYAKGQAGFLVMYGQSRSDIVAMQNICSRSIFSRPHDLTWGHYADYNRASIMILSSRYLKRKSTLPVKPLFQIFIFQALCNLRSIAALSCRNWWLH